MLNVDTAIALPLAAVSTTLTNLAYLREHDAAAALPVLSPRRPVHSLQLLLTDRAWLGGFAMETGGFALYALALALASLALVQSIGAGGIGVLAFATARLSGRRLGRRELIGVSLSVIGLLALAGSLAGGSASNAQGSITDILLWLGLTGVVALLVLWRGRGRLGAVAYGAAAGLLFSIGDISTKLTTDGGARSAFVVTLVVGYAAGTSLLQLGYQRGGALAVAGLSTLLTNALPIAAGTVVLGESLPGGALGALRIVAFAAVTAGAVLITRVDPKAARGSPMPDARSDSQQAGASRSAPPGPPRHS